MFASPLPPGPDLPSVASTGAVGIVNTSMQPLRYSAEPRQAFQECPADESSRTTASGRDIGSVTHAGASVASVQRLRSLDPESRELNLTASLEAFVAGIQGQRTEEPAASATAASPEIETRAGLSAAPARGANDPRSGKNGETSERRVASTMEDYGRSAYTQPVVGSIFPEAYANSYIVAKEGGPGTIPATASSYQVVLSDGTSYPSAVFPAGERRYPESGSSEHRLHCICLLPQVLWRPRFQCL